MLHIRKAELEDLEEIAQVHAESWLNAYREVFCAQDLARGSLEARRQQWRRQLAQPDHGHYVASEQGEIVGFFTLVPARDPDLPPETLELEAIYFAPAQSRKGFGTQCMSFILELARRQGWRHLALWTLEQNRQSRGFYHKIGFHPDGQQRPVGPGCNVPEVRYVLAL